MPRSRWLVWGTVVGMLLCLSLPFSSLGMTMARSLWASSSLSPLVAVGSTPPAVAHSRVLGSMDEQNMLSLSVHLNLQHTAELQQYIHAAYTPGSYLYHHYLRPVDFAAEYGPSAESVQQVSGYLRSEGFTVTHAVPGEQVIDFSGTVGQVERSFDVQINRYRMQNGRQFYANNTPPRLPLALRPFVQQISGLTNMIVRQHPPLTSHTLNTYASGHTTCPSTGSGYYTPAQFASAYDFTGLYNAGYHGEGQNVALFELDSFNSSDISQYMACFDRNAPTHIRTANVDGGPGGTGPGALEVELDMDILLSALPGLSNLTVYQAPNTESGYNDEWMQILRDDIPVVSTSWGVCEAALSNSDVSSEEQFFLQAAAQGQSVMAASGDSGAYDCGDSSLTVDDPASSPYVTGVGGTHLTLGSSNSYGSESSWSNSPDTSYGSGGGISQLWSMPAYQSGPGVINSYSSGTPCQASSGQYCREVPDVAMDADPATGYIVYCTVEAAMCQPSQPFVTVGGTSAAAPMLAAIITLTNQYALAHGGNNLGFLNPTLYSLLNSSSYSSAFHDVTAGTNLYYPARSGYDMATGMGSVDASAFARAAVAQPRSRQLPAATRWYFAEGHVGSGFTEFLTLENPGTTSGAHVTITYLLRGRPSFSRALSVPASTRQTVNVNQVLGVSNPNGRGQDVSLLITSDAPVVAERPIYFTYGGSVAGGSDILGTVQPAQQFTFANGATLPGYSTFISVLNPPGQGSATVTASYYSNGSRIGQSVITVPSGQRGTINVNQDVTGNRQFFIQVDSTQPVTVERPMYFRGSVSGIGSMVTGGSSVPGVSPATSWYFADGSTGTSWGGAQERLILANPETTPAQVNILYALGNRTTKNVSVTVAPQSQTIENVNTDVGVQTQVAAQVTSTNSVGIVVERQQFFNYPGLTSKPGVVETLGTSGVSGSLPTIYTFAEGHLGSSFSEYITLFNPSSTVAHVAITFVMSQGANHYLSQQQVTVAANGIVVVSANNFLNIAAAGAGEDISLVVQSLPGSGGSAAQPVVVERALYFTYQRSMPGASYVTGYAGN